MPAINGSETVCIPHMTVDQPGAGVTMTRTAVRIAAAAWLMAANAAVAQVGNGNRPPLGVPSAPTGSIGAVTVPLPPAAPATPAREWSGESGSSGHPLMSADAIRAAGANFPTCIE